MENIRKLSGIPQPVAVTESVLLVSESEPTNNVDNSASMYNPLCNESVDLLLSFESEEPGGTPFSTERRSDAGLTDNEEGEFW